MDRENIPPGGWVLFTKQRLIRTVITDCPRCGRDHAEPLTFTLLTRPSEEWDYWATCPTNGEPILIRTAVRNRPPPRHDHPMPLLTREGGHP